MEEKEVEPVEMLHFSDPGESENANSPGDEALPTTSDEREVLAATVFALDNSGPASSDFTPPLIPGEPELSAPEARVKP